MANVDRPRGFIPKGHVSGAPYNGAVMQYECDTGHALLGVGDLIEMTGDGYIDILGVNSSDSGLIGVMVGVVPGGGGFNSTTGIFGDNQTSNTEVTLIGVNSRSIALNTAGTILVATDPSLVMIAQEDGDSTPLVLADIGQNIDITSGTPDTTTGNSTMEIDSDTKGTTATDPLRLLRLANTPGNELAAVDTDKPWTDWEVAFAVHSFSGIAVGI